MSRSRYGTASRRERWVHPLIALAGFNLDFFASIRFVTATAGLQTILLLQSYHLGYEVGRYISLERLIEENKERYYETLEQSSQGWHEGNAQSLALRELSAFHS